MTKGDATTHIVQFDGSMGALPLPANASGAHLKVNGTDRVASLAPSKRTTDQTRASFRAPRLASSAAPAEAPARIVPKRPSLSDMHAPGVASSSLMAAARCA